MRRFTLTRVVLARPGEPGEPDRPSPNGKGAVQGPDADYSSGGGYSGSGRVMLAWTRSPLPASFCARTQTL